MKYELCYLVGETKEQDLARIKEEVKNIVSQEGGKWDELVIEEKRKMAYKVGKEARGIYVTGQFEIVKDELEEGEVKNPVENINRKMNLYHDALRFILIKADELPELKVREGKPAFAKSSGNERRDYKKSSYSKKTEPVAVKREKVVPVVATKTEEKKPDFAKATTGEEETPAVEVKEEVASAEPEKNADKSIDEKIDEILNI